MRPKFNVSEEMRALRPELAAIEENWKPIDPENAERWAIVLAVLPALIDIASLSVEDEPSSHILLASLTEKCIQVATKQGSPSWHAAAKALTDLATGTVDSSVEFTSERDRDGVAVIRELLLAFGSGFACRRAPRDVFVQQARWTAWLRQYFASSRSLSAHASKGLANYWIAVLERNAFYFIAPRETKREFIEASKKQRFESVFKVVARGLSVRLPQWLSDLVNDA
jgi:hypothetical protein